MQSPKADPATSHPTRRVTAVVLNWNGWQDTVACLESLRHLETVPLVIVVDNGSTDGSADRIRSAAPWARLVPLPSNRGFAAGMNAGIAVALGEEPGPDYVWILNNDTVAEPSALSRMVALAESDPTTGIVGSRLVDADGSGRVQTMGGGGMNRWLGTPSMYLSAPTRPFAHLVGASLLVRSTLLRRIGGFDERYFFFVEDTDLSLRARRAGWRLAVAEDATVIHRRGASIDSGSASPSLRSDVTMARSAAIFVSSLDLPWRLSAIPLRLMGMLVNRIARGQVDRLLPITRAYVEGLRVARRPPAIPTFGPPDVPLRPAAPLPDSVDGAAATSGRA